VGLVGKRVTAADLLQAGRRNPPRESLPERPEIPLSSSELSSRLVDSPTRRLDDESATDFNGTSPLVDNASSHSDVSTSSGSVDRALSKQVDQASSKQVGQSSIDEPVRPATGELVVVAVSRPDAEASTPLGDSSTKRLVDAATGTTWAGEMPPAEDSRGRSVAPAGTATTYQRITVFLTPAQRAWLKKTGRHLPVDGLSVSDIVRLAVNRLSSDVEAGLPLLAELVNQAYGEAETMTGRRNRGLPPM
jgi:hypothetical protein